MNDLMDTLKHATEDAAPQYPRAETVLSQLQTLASRFPNTAWLAGDFPLAMKVSSMRQPPVQDAKGKQLDVRLTYVSAKPVANAKGDIRKIVLLVDTPLPIDVNLPAALPPHLFTLLSATIVRPEGEARLREGLVPTHVTL